MKVFLRSFAITSSLVMAAIMAASPSRTDQVLNFGVYVSDKPITVVRQFRPVLKALETALADRLGEKVTINIQARIGLFRQDVGRRTETGEVHLAIDKVYQSFLISPGDFIESYVYNALLHIIGTLILVSIIVMLIFHRLVLRPVKKIDRRLNEISTGAKLGSFKLPAYIARELAALCNSVNLLSQRRTVY